MPKIKGTQKPQHEHISPVPSIWEMMQAASHVSEPIRIYALYSLNLHPLNLTHFLINVIFKGKIVYECGQISKKSTFYWHLPTPNGTCEIQNFIPH